ncbi:MAG: sulfatase [Verrucomicrobiales bacterium]|nr:sulfatase [Verrucomicrobiales bacterium]
MKPILLVLLFAFPSLLLADEAIRPNVLMIAVDDLRPMLGCYGDERVKTPNIDALAAESMLFEKAYCNYAKCGLSRLSLMTGLRPGSIEVYDHGYDNVAKFRERRADAIPMSRWFREAGYETRSFGKIDHDGWDVPEDWSAPPEPGREREMWEIFDEGNLEGETLIADRRACPVMQLPDVEDDHFFAGRMTTQVAGILEERDSKKPFFYAVGYRRPHLPFVAPKKYRDLYEPDRSWLALNPEAPSGVPFFPWFNSDGYVGMAKALGEPMPEKMNPGAAMAFNGMEMRSYLGVPVKGPIPEERQLELLGAYAACVSYVDAQVGRLVEQLEKSGLRESTIIVFWSDHGWHLGEMGAWGKMTNYEVGTRIPFLISVPGKQSGRTDSLAALVDLYPTLCDLLDVKPPTHLAGSSLTSVLDDPDAEVKPAVFHSYQRYKGRYFGRAVKTHEYRYVRWTNKKGGLELEELYDQQLDPNETTNIAVEHPEVVARMAGLLD